MSFHDIICSSIDTPAHEEAHSFGLPGFGGVPLSDPEVPPLQRARGEAVRYRTWPMPTPARGQRNAYGSPAACPRAGQSDANSSPQCGGAHRPPRSRRVCPSRARSGRPSRGFADAYAKGGKNSREISTASSRRVTPGWTGLSGGASARDAVRERRFSTALYGMGKETTDEKQVNMISKNDQHAKQEQANPAPALSQPAQFRMVLISFLSAGIGVVAGLVAYALYKLIGFFTNLFFFHRFSTDFTSGRFHHLGPWVIVIPVIGGLIVGIMAKYGTPKIKGHGIPEAMEAVLVNRSRIAPRVAILKPISAAIAIGTGGPFGAEGPIIQTGGAIGSLVSQVLHSTAAERKVLLACGAAAGMSATFNTPIAGVILAIELLLFEFKSRSFIPLVIASTLATAVHMQLLGAGPMFQVSPMDFAIPRGLPFYLLLGLVGGLAAVGFSKLL